MMPPLSRYLVEHVSPDTRRQFAAWNLDASFWLTAPTLIACLMWPAIGVPIVLFLSFYAITLTAFDSLETADVRVKQEDGDA